MTRVALYARYSSDNQRAASIEDQFRLCEERATREEWQVVDTYRDAAISGASMILRPGIQTLLRDAQAGQFDIVLAEALDRVSRDQADVATLFKRLQFAGVTIVTLAEGEISELHVGLKGTMNALFLKDLALKTHRGLRGRVEAGKSGGGLCFGYRVVHQMDARGELIRGDREIDPVQAEIVRRIFREFASGRSALSIASRLNDEGTPSPTGGKWNNTTIRGNALRGTGILNNELYIGRLVWNRLRYLKDPQTGKRVSRLNPQSEWIITEVPDLRIMDDDLWQAVRARQTLIAEKSVNISAGIRASNSRLNGQRRPKSLLSGLVFCGVCGGSCSIRGGDRFACSTHMDNRSCTNKTTIRRPELEDRVLSGLKDRLMTPEAAAEAMRAYVEETNRANHERRASTVGWQTELTKLRKGLKQMLQVIEDGGYTRGMVERMREMEAREDELVALLAAQPQDVPDIHPNVAGIFKHKVERLAETLNHPEDRQEASEAIRALIEKIVLNPGKGRGEMHATLHGELGTLLEFAASRDAGSKNANTPGAKASGVSVSVVAGAGLLLSLQQSQVESKAGLMGCFNELFSAHA